MKPNGVTIALLLGFVCLRAEPASALVNPALQPFHLCERYHQVVCFTVTKVDDANSVATLTQTAIAKGEFSPQTVTLTAADPDLEEAFFDLIMEEDTLVAFIGKQRRGRKLHEVLFYTRDGRWQIAMIDDPQKPAAWRWAHDLDEDYFGTFNGRADRLFELAKDYAVGRYYFPATPCTRFRDDVVIGALPAPGRGVALYDIDGDGDLDVYAASPQGNRLFVQTEPMRFEDQTERFGTGLLGLASASVHFADVNGDGKPDLLAGSAVLLASEGGYQKADLLPFVPEADLQMSMFAEINGDGYPDVVLSLREGGLRLFLNSGSAPFTLREATTDAGLNAEACGAGESGYVCAGDWNDDGRTDLFYAAGGGLILVQDEAGRFAHAGFPLDYEFASAEGEEGKSGGGCFAPLWRPNKYDVITTRDTELLLLVNDGKYAREMNGYGNEITEGTRAMLAVLAEDLNADGLVDLYATTRSQSRNIYFSNRGHGSFMKDHKYDPAILPGKAHVEGAWGAAAGDVNGDGAIDLCLTRSDGAIALMLNDSLRTRGTKEHMLHHEKMRSQIGFVTVSLGGNRGILGAEIQLLDADENVVSRRLIGSNVLTGCRGPDSATFAVMQPRQYTAQVRFSDGAVKAAEVVVESEKHLRIRMENVPTDDFSRESER